MPTPRKGYWVDGKRVPSVTTVLSTIGWGQENLLVWANNLGLEGKKHTEERQRAADIGTIAHQKIDDHLHRRQFKVPDDATQEMMDMANLAFRAYRDWEKVHHVRVVASEFQLTSTTKFFGGTPDSICEVDGETVLVDYKTSKWLFAKHVLQVSAYLDLIAECKGLQIDRAIILRVGKDGVFRALDVSGADLQRGRDAFYHALALHQMKSELERFARGAAELSPRPVISLPTVGRKATA